MIISLFLIRTQKDKQFMRLNSKKFMETALSLSSVKYCPAEFKRGRSSIFDEEYPSRLIEERHEN